MVSVKELIDESKPMIKIAKAQIDLIVAIIESTRDPRIATAVSATLREVGALYNDAAEKLAAHVPKSAP